MKLHVYYVYILTNKNQTVFYTGVTSRLLFRMMEHKDKENTGFSGKYKVNQLVYYEQFPYIDLAIQREKQIKGYSRAKKVALITRFNPEFRDLIVDGTLKHPSDFQYLSSPDTGDSSLRSE